jgi:hypothetical protein
MPQRRPSLVRSTRSVRCGAGLPDRRAQATSAPRLDHRLGSRFRLLSGAELSKVMIEVFISHDGPLDRRHRSEEGVRVCGASFRSSRRKLVNHLKQTLLLRGKPLLAYNNQALVCGHVPADRIRAQNGFLRHLSEHPPKQTSRWGLQSGCHFHPRGTMRHHLRDVHCAPQPFAVRLKTFDPLSDLHHGRVFKQTFHGCFSFQHLR